MLTLRRPDSETRIELMPLIDVIFLILTFFIYAMVLMVQIDVMPVPMESYVSGTSAEPVPATSITIDLAGRIYVGQQAASIEEVPGMLDHPDLAVGQPTGVRGRDHAGRAGHGPQCRARPTDRSMTGDRHRMILWGSFAASICIHLFLLLPGMFAVAEAEGEWTEFEHELEEHVEEQEPPEEPERLGLESSQTLARIVRENRSLHRGQPRLGFGSASTLPCNPCSCESKPS